jgi:hypothetical protein
MSEELRLLDPSNESDIKALHKVLDQFIEYEAQKQPVMRIRSLERNQEIVQFHKDKFNPDHANDIVIGAKFSNGEIIDVFGGFKLHLLKGFPYNQKPIWFQSIWHSTYQEFKIPEEKKRNIALLVVDRMERDKYYTWYNCMKFPNYKTEEQCAGFIDNVLVKNLNNLRYISYLEYVLWKDQDIESVPFPWYKNILRGATQNRNMCIVSYHLRPELRKFLR